MDVTKAMAPKSDQLNAEDLLTGPRVFTVKEGSEGSHEQPVNIHLEEMPGRPYRPSKTMLRIIAAAWGTDTTAWHGRRLLLVRNPEIKFGHDKVGGIEIAEMSHIDRPLSLPLTVTRGRRKNFAVKPLREDAAPATRPGQVPQDVIEKVQRYVKEGKVQQYLDWAIGQRAPQFVLDYIEHHLPEEPAPVWAPSDPDPADPAEPPAQDDPPADQEPPVASVPSEDELAANTAWEPEPHEQVQEQQQDRGHNDRSTLTSGSSEPIGAGNVRVLSALLTEAGFASTSQKLNVLSQQAGREVTALDQLTKAEGQKFIKSLQDQKAAHQAQTAPEPNGDTQ